MSSLDETRGDRADALEPELLTAYAELRERAAAALLTDKRTADAAPPWRSVTAAPEIVISIDRLSKLYKGRAKASKTTPTLLGRFSRTAGELGLPADDLDDVDADDADDQDEVEDVEEVTREVWALRNISLQIARGTSIGIIGPNGAGKTTLLKVLGRITPPTEGHVIIRGRVAPLMGVVTSVMQPHFTGRENIFLLARFLGVPREIAEQQTEKIMAFAELEHMAKISLSGYSSGQVRRLGFSIMLNLEPDVVLADETLEVGDPEFMTRCWQAIDDARKDGLTVLQVSHDMDHVRRSCDAALWIERGEILQYGAVDEVASIWERRILRKQAIKAAKLSGEPLTARAEEEAEPPADSKPRADRAVAPERAPKSAGAKTLHRWIRGTREAPAPGDQAARLIRYLRIAQGADSATAALEVATDLARRDRDDRVRWWAVAEAAGMSREEAERVLERMSAEASTQGQKKRTFNEHVSIIGAGIFTKAGAEAESLRVDEPAVLEIWVEAATAGVQFGCTVELVAPESPTLRVIQHDPHLVAAVGPHRINARIPHGVLGDGQYRARVAVRTFLDGEKSTLMLQDAFTVDVYDPRPADERPSGAAELIERTDLNWVVKR